jgi:phosphatidylethanolamine-binding protein
MLSLFKTLLLATSLAASTALCAANASDEQTYTHMASTMLQFSNAGLVPQVIPAELFSLSAALQVTYGNETSADLGSIVPAEHLASAPTYQLNYTGEVQQQQVFWSQLFTVLAFDAGYPSSNESSGIWRQYLANNMTVMQADGVLQNMTDPVTAWTQPNITQDSGPHRFVQLVFAQGPDFAPIANLTNSTGSNAANMQLAEYVQQANLGKIVAANYFIVQNGTKVDGDLPVSSTQAVASASVTAMASKISASIIAEGTRAVLLKDSAAASSMLSSNTAAAAILAAVSIASACTLFL